MRESKERQQIKTINCLIQNDDFIEINIQTGDRGAKNIKTLNNHLLMRSRLINIEIRLWNRREIEIKVLKKERKKKIDRQVKISYFLSVNYRVWLSRWSYGYLLKQIPNHY